MRSTHKRRKVWTQPEAELLRQLHAEGLDDTECAARLGRSIGSVAEYRANKLRLPAQNRKAYRCGAAEPWSEREDSILATMHAGGNGDEQISEHLGRGPDGAARRSPNAVRLRRHLLGIVDEKRSRQQREAAAQRAREGTKRYMARISGADAQAEAPTGYQSQKPPPIRSTDQQRDRQQRIAAARATNDARRQEAFRRQFGRHPNH